ncbi:MAG: hypothetical protein K1X89_00685 [Myxococcaceae bacterium]|nr:hypothetical protein [Myxococcaceae bacterium]
MRYLACTVLLSLAACGSGNSFTGTVGGESLVVKQSALVTGTDSSGNLTGLVIVLSDQVDLCAQLSSNKLAGNALGISLTSTGASGALVPPTPGDYRVEATGGLQARASLRRTVGTSVSNFDAKAGTVKLSALRSGADGSAAGTYELTLGEALEKVTGSFNAPLCVVGNTVTVIGVGGDLCNTPSKCSADPMSSDADKKACQTALKSDTKCSAEYRGVLVCLQSKQKCTTENKTDSTAFATDCKPELDAYVACVQK